MHQSLRGRIHSYEAGSLMDGPGIRFVAFLQGCPLHCIYCQNPDLRNPEGGIEMEPKALIDEALKYKNYFDASHGGLTLSGGDPLLQAAFTASCFKEAKRQGLRTALDTSGYADPATWDQVLPFTDLVLLDIKSFDPGKHLQVTGVSREPILSFARYLSKKNKPYWVRFVLIPGKTNQVENMRGIASFCEETGGVERIEILAFHQLGRYKWEALGLHYPLANQGVPLKEDMQEAVGIFKMHTSIPIFTA